MLFKKTYLLIKRGPYAPQIPIPCTGRSGKNYGFYTYDKALRAHTIRIPGEVWEPDSKGNAAGPDITRKLRQVQLPEIICEVEPGPDIMKLEDELSQLRAGSVETVPKRLYERSLRVLKKVSEVAPDGWLEETVKRVQEEEVQEKAQLATNLAAEQQQQPPDAFDALGDVDEAAAKSPAAPATAPAATEAAAAAGPEDKLRKELRDANYRTLRGLCQEANRNGAGISLTNPKKVKMEEDLYAFYQKNLTALKEKEAGKGAPE